MDEVMNTTTDYVIQFKSTGGKWYDVSTLRPFETRVEAVRAAMIQANKTVRWAHRVIRRESTAVLELSPVAERMVAT